MKYCKQGTYGIEHYEIVNYNIEKTNCAAMIKLLHASITPELEVSVEFSVVTIVDTKATIIDPNWNAASDPPKPEGFDIMNPLTWDNLTWDDIPRTIDSSQLYYTNFVELTKTLSVDEAIFSILIEKGDLPSGNDWFYK